MRGMSALLAVTLGLLGREALGLSEECKKAASAVAESAYVSQEQAESLVEFVLREKVDLIMRPLNADALSLRSAGHPPKPKAIKWKTCSEDDLKLGFPGKGPCVGLVILFNPTPPRPQDAGNSDLQARYEQRKAEWKSYEDSGKKYPSTAAEATQAKAVAYLEDGFVKDPKEKVAFTGDLDLFDITDPNGPRLARNRMISVVNKLRLNPKIDVLHGAHMNWQPSSKEQHIFEAIVTSHKSPDKGGKGKFLVRLGADCTTCKVYGAADSTSRTYPCVVEDGAPDAGTPIDAGTPMGADTPTDADTSGTPEPEPEPKAEYMHILLDGKCTKVRITRYGDSTINFDDERGYESFIWDFDWPEKRCGAAAMSPWPGKKGKLKLP